MKRPVIELALVLGAAAIPFGPTPLLPMVAVASLVVWIGGEGWAVGGPGALRAALAGAAVGAIALVTLAAIDPDAIAVGQLPAARGSLEVAAIAVVLAAAAATAAEMVRGLVIARLLAITGDRPIAAVSLDAFAWVLVFAPASPAAAAGLAVVAAGFGLLYLACGRRLILPIAAHVTYEVGAVLAVSARLI